MVSSDESTSGETPWQRRRVLYRYSSFTPISGATYPSARYVGRSSNTRIVSRLSSIRNLMCQERESFVAQTKAVKDDPVLYKEFLEKAERVAGLRLHPRGLSAKGWNCDSIRLLARLAMTEFRIYTAELMSIDELMNEINNVSPHHADRPAVQNMIVDTLNECCDILDPAHKYRS